MIDREAGRGTIEILESNVEIFNLFVRSQTQWVRDTMGRLQGLNYIQVEFIAGRIGVELDADNFEKLQTLETKAKDLANDGAS